MTPETPGQHCPSASGVTQVVKQYVVPLAPCNLFIISITKLSYIALTTTTRPHGMILRQCIKAANATVKTRLLKSAHIDLFLTPANLNLDIRIKDNVRLIPDPAHGFLPVHKRPVVFEQQVTHGDLEHLGHEKPSGALLLAESGRWLAG